MGAISRSGVARGLAIAALVGLLAACGARTVPGGAGDISIAPAPSADPFTSALIMTRTWAAAEMESTVRATIDGASRELAARGEVAMDKGYAALTWTSGSATSRELVNDRAIFTQDVAPDGPWTRTESGGRTPTSAFADPLLNLASVEGVAVDGSDEIDGFEAVRYRGTLPVTAGTLEGLALTDDEIARIVAASTPDDTVTVTAWADPNRRLVRIERRLVLDGDSGIQADVVASTRLWNFGVMLDLESPPSGSVVTARP